MRRMSLAQSQRLVSVGLCLAALVSLAWWLSPGLPVLIGPWAWSGQIARGEELFRHEWEPNDPLAGGDGLGPVYNAKSCAACHFQAGLGGAGAGQGNVRSFHTIATKDRPESARGLIHLAAVERSWEETPTLARKLFPIIKGGTIRRQDGHCSYVETIPDFDPLVIENLNSMPLFGAGWIDLIPGKAIVHQSRLQAVAGTWDELAESKFSIKPRGRAHVLPDGRIGKFGWKAQFATLEEFVASACANELGLSTPVVAQPAPLGAPEYVSKGTDISRGQLRDMTAFVSTLSRPMEVMPDDPGRSEIAARGKSIFLSVGCAACHVPDLAGVKGVYSDFLLHDVDSHIEGGGSSSYGTPPRHIELIAPDPRSPQPSEWKTPPLWGVADSGPYFHDGGSPTLQEAIFRHRGDATGVMQEYRKLPFPDQLSVVAFLETLRAPPDAAPVPQPVIKSEALAQQRK
jgi:CxxC motif-containing protein (DUF1111 family)